MVKTYQVLDARGIPLAYFERLKDAQRWYLKNRECSRFIRLLIGAYYGEGFQEYVMCLNDITKKFYYTMRR